MQINKKSRNIVVKGFQDYTPANASASFALTPSFKQILLNQYYLTETRALPIRKYCLNSYADLFMRLKLNVACKVKI